MYKVALGAVLLLFIHMWVKEVLREEENNEKRKEGLLSIISTDGELQKQIDIIRKYRHDIPKHIHMMEEAIDRDIMEKRFCDNELLNAVAKIKEAEGEAEAILKIKEAEAQGLSLIKNVKLDEATLKLKSYEALMNIGQSESTKIIIPSELQGLASAGVALKEIMKDKNSNK